MADGNQDDEEATALLYRYFPNLSTAGIFFSVDPHGLPFFAEFRPCLNQPRIPDTRAIYSVPDNYSAVASSWGLILCRNSESSYSVANPASGQHVYLPPSTRQHDPATTAPAIVRLKHEDIYRVVCAVEDSERPGYYGFDLFCSIIGNWESSQWDQHVGEIITNSGVSDGRRAYWRTKTPSVVFYNARNGDKGIIEIPAIPGATLMQLGIDGDDLCLVCVTDDSFVIYRLDPQGVFRLLRIMNDTAGPIAVPRPAYEPPRPLRFESFKLEAQFWVADHVVILEEMIPVDGLVIPQEEGLVFARIRELSAAEVFDNKVPVNVDDCVPHVDCVEARIQFPLLPFPPLLPLLPPLPPPLLQP